MTDKELIYCQCATTFIFSKTEQESFVSKDLTNEPKRCQSCRLKQRLQHWGQQIPLTEVPSAQCGETTSVPFKPS